MGLVFLCAAPLLQISSAIEWQLTSIRRLIERDPISTSPNTRVKSGTSMELFLNFAWTLLAIAIVGHWFKLGHSGRSDRRLQVIALVMLLAILFPVISVSDDLWSIQNPAETDTYQRRDHFSSISHSNFDFAGTIPLPVFAGMSLGYQRFAAPRSLPLFAVDNPAFEAIQNRPPPTA